MRLGNVPSSDTPFDDRLHQAADRGDLGAVQALVAEGLPLNAPDPLGHTPLNRAAVSNRFEVVEYLVNAGADVNAQGCGDGWQNDTPLGSVVADGSFEMVMLLLDLGADPSVPGWMGNTPLHRAETRKRRDAKQVHKLLLEAARRIDKHAGTPRRRTSRAPKLRAHRN